MRQNQSSINHQNLTCQILIVSGGFGKDLRHYLKNYMENSVVHPVIKPCASNSEVVDTVITNKNSFNKQDILIFWLTENISYHFHQLHSGFVHTNFSVRTTPYFSSSSDHNDEIQSNLSLFKEVQPVRGSLNYIMVKSNYCGAFHGTNRNCSTPPCQNI